MGDLVFPATDAGVLAQVIGLLLVAGLLLWAVRRGRSPGPFGPFPSLS